MDQRKEIVSRDGSREVRHFKIQRTSSIVLNNKDPNVGYWYSLRNISVIKLCVHVVVTKFKLPTVVCALRWDHHESGVRDHHVVSHDCKVHAFNISTFQLYEQLSTLLVFRKAKKIDLIISHLNFWFYRLTKISTAFLTLILLTWRIWWAPNNASKWQMEFYSAFKGLISVTSNDSQVGLYN